MTSSELTIPRLVELLKRRSKDLEHVDLSLIKQKIESLKPLLNSEQEKIFDAIATFCNDKSYIDPQWSILAGRIKMEYVHLITPRSFSECSEKMGSLLEPNYQRFVLENAEELDGMIVPERDFDFNLFAVSTLIKAYLGKASVGSNKMLLETPQYMYLRVAAFLWFPDLEKIRTVYDDMSTGSYSHASPTLFNAGYVKHQLSSCFLLHTKDSIDGISKGWRDSAFISMNSGGLGIDFSSLRHSEIGNVGTSKGVIPWLRITNMIIKGVDQGGKRNGSATVFLRDCHIDVFEFIEIRDEGPEDMRAKDLFPALMISDLFMRKVIKDESWCLFCPKKVPFADTWGKKFEELYLQAEKEGKYSRRIKARDLWMAILIQQERKGTPFVAYIDACNRKNNQQHAGMIRNLNLCMEIAENTSEEEIASCNLASICLSKCYKIEDGKTSVDHEKIERLTRQVVRNLNQVVDRNYYIPDVPEIRTTNLKHRPLGVGVQGFADLAAILDIPWVEQVKHGEKEWQNNFVTHPLMKQFNNDVFETMYYSAIDESCEMAKERGYYPSFPGSFASKGLFQSDLWDIEQLEKEGMDVEYTLEFKEKHVERRPSRYTVEEIERIRTKMITHGLYNSNLTSLMPTASTAQIRRNNEAFEPFTELIYTRTVLSGQFMVVNEHLVKDLRKIGLWNGDVIQNIINNQGSVQNLENEGLEFLKLKYRSAYEIPQRTILELSADRGRFICQTQSLNCFMAQSTKAQLSAYHIAGWKMGLKTGMYYKRSAALVSPLNVALNHLNVPKERKKVECNDEVCFSCQ